jgi:hypothetical protein
LILRPVGFIKTLPAGKVIVLFAPRAFLPKVGGSISS